MIKQFKKGEKISYKYQSYGKYTMRMSNNISSIIFNGYGDNYLKKQLKSVDNLDENVCILGEYCFNQSEILEEVNIGNSNVQKIGDYSFSDCKSLTSVNLNCNEMDIGQSVFQNCQNLMFVSFNGQEKDIL